MSLRGLLFFILFIVFSAISQAQVSLQTGAAQYNIPIFNFSDPANRISTGISLIYTSGNGLKVSEIGSSVGTGWTLDFGGYIQRIQRGQPDDQKNNDTYTYPGLPDSDPNSGFWTWAKDYYPNGFLYSEFAYNDVLSNRLAYTPMYPTSYYYYQPPQKYSADREQDMFQFSFNGMTGYFVIGKKNSSGVFQIRTLNDSKLKIELTEGDLANTQNIRTTISKFTVTDEMGIQYVFADADVDQVCNYESGSEFDGADGRLVSNLSHMNGPSYDNIIRMTKGTPRNAYTKNKWNLTEIKNPQTNEKITFVYDVFSIDMPTTKLIQQSVSSGSNRISIVQDRSISQVKKIKQIITSTNQSVEFIYSSQNRIDVPGDKSLSQIQLKVDNQVKQNWKFRYGYFVKTDIKDPNYNFTSEDKLWSRLCLLEAKKYYDDLQGDPPYTFDYYRGNEDNLNSAVPPMFATQQDLGGYYSVMSMGYFNPTTATVNLTNPPYEPGNNTVYPRTFYQNLLDGLNYNPSLGYGTGSSDVRPTIEARNGIIRNVNTPAGGVISWDFENNMVGSASAPKDYYGVRVKSVSIYNGIDHSKDLITEYKYLNDDNTSSAWGYENFENTETVPVRIMQECGPGKAPLYTTIAVAKPVVMVVMAKAGILPIGGMFKLPNPAFAFAQIFILMMIDQFADNGSTYKTLNVTNRKSTALNSNLLPFQYAQVQVINKLGTGDVGKTIYRFTSPSTSPLFEPDFGTSTVTYPYSYRQRYAFWLYGLPEKVTIKDKDDKIVRMTVNEYTPIKSFLNDPLFTSKKWLPTQYEYSCGFNPPIEEESAYNKIISQEYYPIVGRIELTKTRDYLYNSGQSFTMHETNFEYSTANYQIRKTSSSNSKGELIETFTYYPDDYTLSGSIQALKDKHMLNAPVATQTFITKPGNQKYLLSGSVSEYSVLANGDINVSKTYEAKLSVPVAESSVVFNQSQLVPTNSYKEVSNITYNTLGLPVETRVDEGKSCIIYDKDSRLPIANASNASIDQVAYTSFETSDYGGWTIVNGGTIANFGVTGHRAFSGSMSKSISQPGNYIVTLWGENSQSQTINGDPGQILQTVGNWTLKKWVLGGSNILITGNYIDEVRVQPVKSQMSTATLEPLIGITARSDENNRITFYEYDGTGRLRLIKDEAGNIIQVYDYNFKK